MSIEVIYQGLTIAKGPSFRLQDGGVFVELEGPMPVATALSLTHGDNALHGQVRRVAEGTGAGMLIVPRENQKLPRWLLPLGPTSVANVELEPEPAPVVVETAPPAAESAPAAECAPAAAEAAKSENAGSEFLSGEPAPDAAEPVAASGHTPSEQDAGAKDEEDESAAKPADKKAPAAASAKKKKGRKR